MWNYKHCFKVKTQSEEEGRNYFELKHYSICSQIKNIIMFLLGKNVIGGAKPKSGVKIINKDGKY